MDVTRLGDATLLGIFGSGYGYGSGYGDGYGYGSGSGYGDGSGYGYGYGYGDGDGYWKTILPLLAAKLNAVGKRLALWWSDENGQPCNGGKKMEAANVGDIHTAPGPLTLCASGTLHATLNPGAWKGKRLWVVALHGEVIGDDEKLGCLKREILMEIGAESQP